MVVHRSIGYRALSYWEGARQAVIRSVEVSQAALVNDIQTHTFTNKREKKIVTGWMRKQRDKHKKTLNNKRENSRLPLTNI